jgi:hypothetical protein
MTMKLELRFNIDPLEGMLRTATSLAIMKLKSPAYK